MKESINNRVAEIRKKFGLTQAKFGKEIGLTSSSAISLIESGENMLTEANIKLICRCFSVNEGWLRYGHGEMISTDKEESFLSFREREILAIFRKLTESMKEIFLQIGRNMLNAEDLKKTEMESTRLPDAEYGIPTESLEKRDVI